MRESACPAWDLGLAEGAGSTEQEGTSRVQPTTELPAVLVTADGQGVVSHVGARLLAGLSAATGLTAAYSEAMASTRERRGGHDPGRVLADLAVMLADGGEAISDLAVLRDQPELFGRVASTATAWRVL